MRLYLVRHAIAEESARNDAWRVLTDKGRRRFRRTARAFGRSDRLDLILTSPLVRAVQTAEILAGQVKHGAMRVLDQLEPGNEVTTLLAAVAKAAGKAGSVALVGHDPQLTATLAALTRIAASRLDFRKGAIVCLEVSGLPKPKSVDARFWLKPRSGSKKNGLPLKPVEKKAAPKKAVTKKRAKPAVGKTAKPAPAPVQTFMDSPQPAPAD